MEKNNTSLKNFIIIFILCCLLGAGFYIGKTILDRNAKNAEIEEFIEIKEKKLKVIKELENIPERIEEGQKLKKSVETFMDEEKKHLTKDHKEALNKILDALNTQTFKALQTTVGNRIQELETKLKEIEPKIVTAKDEEKGLKKQIEQSDKQSPTYDELKEKLRLKQVECRNLAIQRRDLIAKLNTYRQAEQDIINCLDLSSKSRRLVISHVSGKLGNFFQQAKDLLTTETQWITDQKQQMETNRNKNEKLQAEIEKLDQSMIAFDNLDQFFILAKSAAILTDEIQATKSREKCFNVWNLLFDSIDTITTPISNQKKEIEKEKMRQSNKINFDFITESEDVKDNKGNVTKKHYRGYLKTIQQNLLDENNCLKSEITVKTIENIQEIVQKEKHEFINRKNDWKQEIQTNENASNTIMRELQEKIEAVKEVQFQKDGTENGIKQIPDIILQAQIYTEAAKDFIKGSVKQTEELEKLRKYNQTFADYRHTTDDLKLGYKEITKIIAKDDELNTHYSLSNNTDLNELDEVDNTQVDEKIKSNNKILDKVLS